MSESAARSNDSSAGTFRLSEGAEGTNLSMKLGSEVVLIINIDMREHSVADQGRSAVVRSTGRRTDGQIQTEMVRKRTLI